MRASIDHTTMREMNLALILKTLRVHAPVARVALANLTGLNKTTVSTMVRLLLESGLVREVGVDMTSGDVGRRAINLEINPAAGAIVSLEIGVGFISILVTDFALGVLSSHSEDVAPRLPYQQVWDRTLALLRETVNQLAASGQPLLGIALGVPGLVDMASGTLLFAPNLKWRDVPLGALLKAECDVPVCVVNEANSAAWGESYFGPHQDNDFLLYVSSGNGIGGGIVLNNELVLGASGFASEMGHMTIDPSGLRCNCGNIGCWETVASQMALERRIREAIGFGRASLLSELTGNDLSRLTIPLLIEAARRGDAVTLEALETTGRWLGIGIANLLNIINPQCVVFGGTLSAASDWLLPVIRDTVEQRALKWVQQNAAIVVAAHGPNATVMGGAAMIHHELLSNPSHLLP